MNLKEQLGELTEQQRKDLLSRVLLEKKKQQPRHFPLSFAQQRLWFLHQMGDGSAAYHVPTALRLRGALDVPLLERCFGEVVRRHESLRTTFEANPATGAPEQVIHPWTPFRIELFDLSDEPLDEALRHARELANNEAQRAFNLSTGPLRNHFEQSAIRFQRAKQLRRGISGPAGRGPPDLRPTSARPNIRPTPVT